MDPYTRAFYELCYKVAFMERRGEAFQDFFSSIMEKRYPSDFRRVRPWGNDGDRKNDGYLPSQRMLFQSYAPNEMTAAKCIAKIDEDFNGALPYWQQYFDTWVFVHNSREGLGPDQTKKLLDLETLHAGLSVKPWGFEELRQEAMALAECELASLLGEAPSRAGMASLGLADLVPVLDQISRLPPTPDPDLRPVPTDKLQRNMLSEDVRSLLKAGMSRADLVRKYFTMHPTLQDQLAASFSAKYVALRTEGQSPDDIFMGLQGFAGGDTLRSAQVQNAVLAVLSFFFEECDIFERSEADEGDA